MFHLIVFYSFCFNISSLLFSVRKRKIVHWHFPARFPSLLRNSDALQVFDARANLYQSEELLEARKKLPFDLPPGAEIVSSTLA